MAPTLVRDPVDLAIAAAAAEPPKVRMTEIRFDLAPGRFAVLAIPVDLNLTEVLGLVGYLTAGGLAQSLAEARKPQLEIARSLPPT